MLEVATSFARTKIKHVSENRRACETAISKHNSCEERPESEGLFAAVLNPMGTQQ